MSKKKLSNKFILKSFKLNSSIGGYKEGSIIQLECKKSGSPKDLYWRKRLHESVKDNCIEEVKTKVAPVVKKVDTEDKKDN